MADPILVEDDDLCIGDTAFIEGRLYKIVGIHGWGLAYFQLPFGKTWYPLCISEGVGLDTKDPQHVIYDLPEVTGMKIVYSPIEL